MSPTRKLSRCFLLILCTLLLVPALAQSAGDPPFDPAGKLLASDGSDDHNFGRALDIDGQTAVIGAPSWDAAGKVRQGAAYVFTRDGGGWAERVHLTDEDPRASDGFGSAIALDGDTVAVGMFNRLQTQPIFANSAGAVAVFTGTGANWTQQATLKPDDLVDMNFFGMSVDLDGDTLIIGAPTFFSTINQSAYVYTRNGSTWSQQDKLTPPDELVNRLFGRAVAVAGDVALVGAPHGNQLPTPPGEVYVFTRDGDTWSPAGTIAPDDSADGDNFGCAIDFDGQTAVIGACEAYDVTPGPGKAYVFTRTGNTWTQQAKLIAEVDGLPLDVDDVALYGNRVALGSEDAPKALGEWTGAAFVYERQGQAWAQASTWAHVQTLYAADAQTEDAFGLSVALSADTLLAGAPDKNVLNNGEQGAAYAFQSDDITEPGHALYLPVVMRPGVPTGADDLIVYTDEVGSNPDIFTITPDGANKTNLTRSPAGEYGPRWSPDRQRIAFSRVATGGVSHLWVMNADGSGQRQIPTPGLDMMGGPDWSPNGLKIVFSAYTDNIDWDIYVVGVDGGGLTNLTADLPGEASEPSWSPDGTQIVFRHYPDKTDLVVMNADGSGKKNLTDDAFSQNYPAWSPDGGSILLFGGPGGGSPALYTMPAAGGAPELLIENASYGRWSADGAGVVFNGGGGGIFRADADGGNLKAVDESPEAGWADW